MATRITDTEMTSDQTRHTATVLPGATVEGGPTAWSVTWLPGRAFTRNQAITAMTIADVIGAHDVLGDPLHAGHRLWPHLDNWAAELGISGPHAVAEASLSPEDRECLDAPPAAGNGPGPADDEGGGAVWAAPADGRGNSPLDLTHPERSGFIDVMTDHERSVLLAHIAGYAPEVFDHALTSRSESFADELAERVDAKETAEYMAEPDGFCTVCGENVAHFFGYEGPQHFRGPHKLVTGSERRELFTPEDGHAPQVAWRPSGESPGGAQ